MAPPYPDLTQVLDLGCGSCGPGRPGDAVRPRPGQRRPRRAHRNRVEYEWRSGTVVYEWHHRNWYRTSICLFWNIFVPGEPCVEWVSTGDIVEPRDPCATVPAWSATEPSGASCDLHESWVEDGIKYDWERHRTEQTGEDRCYLPGSGVQPPSRSTNTDPPGGQSPVYQDTDTAPSQYEGAVWHCGWWDVEGLPRPPTPHDRARGPRTRTRSVEQVVFV